ncbi:MAG: diphosphomevalonate decarboxylase [Anaerolineaceae bacterium]
MTDHLKSLLQPATAIAHPNIAFIKYWGNRHSELRLPLTGSISMNLDGLQTTTTVCPDERLQVDSFSLDGVEQVGASLVRVSKFLDSVRQTARHQVFARIESSNNFPVGAGIASSASAFAALAVAAASAYGLNMSEAQLSALARLGSGSASRSVPAGFVEWQAADTHDESFAWSIAPANHWKLIDVIAILDPGHKKTGSTDGHRLAQTSPLNSARIALVPERLERCRRAILTRDFEALAEVTEADSEHMHVVMRTSTPPLIYQTAQTLVILQQVKRWRSQGHAVCSTVDAGPNVHVIAMASEQAWLEDELKAVKGVNQWITCQPGGGAKLVCQSLEVK